MASFTGVLTNWEFCCWLPLFIVRLFVVLSASTFSTFLFAKPSLLEFRFYLTNRPAYVEQIRCEDVRQRCALRRRKRGRLTLVWLVAFCPFRLLLPTSASDSRQLTLQNTEQRSRNWLPEKLRQRCRGTEGFESENKLRGFRLRCEEELDCGIELQRRWRVFKWLVRLLVKSL